ncbi:MAG: hypothetical protein AB9882_02560 [Ignavibacteriaceae bacterium]
MNNFSSLEESFKGFAEAITSDKQAFDIVGFSEKEKSKENQQKRIAKALANFSYFDKTYFPPELYGDGYHKPNKMLTAIAGITDTLGYHLFLGPRKHGKTVTAKKLLIYLLVRGKVKTAGTYAETIPKSSNILKDIGLLLDKNSRIKYDFGIEIIEFNSDQLVFTVKNSVKGYRTIAAFSEGRSVRGYSRLFDRPEFLLGDDIETLGSSFSKEAVQLRIDKLVEAYSSLSEKAIFLILGNDIVQGCAMHQLRLMYEKKLLPQNFYMYVYKAFDKFPLWKEKYPCKTEAEMRALIKPLGEADWQANYQQNPVPPEGVFFKRENYHEYEALPDDARGVIYCDPNLSKKGLGNTTAIVAFLYSAKTDHYYVERARCKSFSDSNVLLDSILEMKSERIYGLAFDGNVTQESNWTNNVRNYCRINNIPFPRIEYMRFHVNELAKNTQMIYADNKILFPKHFSQAPEGETFLGQLFSFSGEKASGNDDAPDALICAVEYLHKRKITRGTSQPTVAYKDFYSM